MEEHPTVTESEALKVYQRYWDSYLKGDLEAFSSTIDDRVEMIGTSEGEICHSKAEGIAFYRAQMSEVVGKVEMRNRQIASAWLDPLVLVNEFCDIYVQTDDGWIFYSKLRLSTLMGETSEGWKVVQQHGSLPDMRVGEGETLAIEKISKENLELRDAIKRRTIELENKNRELEIEAALERTRTQSMLMQQSSELLDISKVFHEQLLFLKIDAEFSFVWLPNEDKGDHLFWATWMQEQAGEKHYHSKAITYPLDMEEPYTVACFNDWRSGVAVHEHFIMPEDVAGFFASWEELLAGAEKLKAPNFPNGIYYTEVYMRYGCFGIDIRRSISTEEKDILLRFAIEFERAYTRFLDLQKAEAQAREAQIEAALEKVRSRSLAMHKADELLQVATVMRAEMADLGVEELETSSIYTMLDHETAECWYAIKDVRGQDSSLVFDEMTIDLKATQVGREMLNFFKGNSQQTSILMKGEQRKEWINYCASCSNVLKGYYGHEIPERTYHLVKFSHGYVGAATPGSISNESWSLLRRMTAVFSLAYTRFLDLQRAEAQAREAQIEAALERVRSKTMAMHNSKDVGESVATLFDELTSLGLLTSRDRCGIGIMQPDEVMELWTADKSIEKTELTIGHLDMRPHALLRNVYQAWLDRMETFRYTLKGEDKQLYAEAIVNQPRYKIRRDYFSSVENIEHTDFFFEEGCLYVFSEDAISNESASVFSRFVKVFGQTYRRFLDLQNAEKQAREAQIESALEKVRSRTMAMQSSDELADAAYVLFEQLKTLGVTHERINVGIVNEDSHTIDFWITEQGGDKLNTKFSGRISEPTTLSKVYAAWKDGAKSLIVDLQGEELKSWLSYLSDEIKIPFNKSFLHDRRVQTAGFFSKGMIILSSPEPLQYEALYLLEKFAGVFDLTYTRFSDLKLAEAQALQAEKDLIEIKIARQKAEEALDELKSTQSQLIQQEKLASLGQLTAGIAHEIKNPLNFVNNFSNVSLEMIDEAREELSKSEDPALALDIALVLDILADIKTNLTKIHEHGSRADGIVKSMLQHSRGGTGKMEPTDLNALVKEFTNLSYHGMRAGKDPIEAEVTIVLDETIGEIPLVYEDFSRVILNICSNAFDAMRGSVQGSGIGDQRSGTTPKASDFIKDGAVIPTKSGPSPEVTGGSVIPSELSGLPEVTGGGIAHLQVRTRREGNRVTIEIEDNGPGIPDDIKDKILQPFFTTKKGTQGTGLGLSITHDILKAHGGSIDILSQPGKTIFLIKFG